MAAAVLHVNALLILLTWPNIRVTCAARQQKYTTCVKNCSCEIEERVFIKVDCSQRGWMTVPTDFPTTIKYLDLSRNRISSLTYKHLSYLENLRELNVSHNDITILPDWPSEKYNNSFVAEVNDHDGVVKRSGHELSNSSIILKQMRLEQMNLLSNFRPGGLKQFRMLDVSNNLLTRIENNTFTSLTDLQVLNLSHNKITTLNSLSFGGLGCLVFLDLSYNSIIMSTESYPDDVFSELQNLRELNLQGNSISSDCSPVERLTTPCKPSALRYPDKALSHLNLLEKLRIDGLPEDKIPGVGFRNLTQLTLLDIGNLGGMCAMKWLSEDFFSNIATTKPIEVLFKWCNIVYIHPNTFSYLPTLRSLSLYRNKFLGFENFSVCSQSFSRTEIKNLDLTRITHIHRESRRLIKVIPEWFQYLRNTSLEVLILDDNYIMDMDKKVPVILPRSIKVFSMTHNKIIWADGFKQMYRMGNLEILNLSVQNEFTDYLLIPKTDAAPDFYRTFIGQSQILEEKSSDFRNNQEILCNHSKLAFNDTSSILQFSETSDCVSKSADGGFHGRQTHYDCISHSSWLQLQKALCPSMKEKSLKPLAKNITYAISRPHQLELMYEVLSGKNISIDVPRKILVPLPRSLKEFYINRVKVGYAIPEITFLNNVLEQLDVSNNFLWCFDGPLYRLHKLKILDLSHNYCIAINPMFFTDMPALETLLLSYNTLGPSLEDDENATTFSKNTRLRFIDLSHNGIRVLHSDAFLKTCSLQTVFLNNNAIRKFKANIGHLVNLTLLDLSSNDLSTLSPKTMQDIEQILSVNSNLRIDIAKNPLLCDCSTLDFLNWYRGRKVLFLKRDVYQCEFINGTTLSLKDLDNFYYSLWKTCNGSVFLVFSLSGFFIILILWISIGISCMYRVRLLFYIYISKKRYFHTFTHPELHSVKDVFLVYDEDEPQWRRFVIDIVQPSLRDRGVSCFISEIEAMAGKPMRMVIEESVLAAQKTLVLLTKDLFQLQEREIEVNMALLSEEMRMSQVLFFILLEDMNYDSIPVHLRRSLENSVIIYNQNNPHFWDRVAQIIKS